MALEPVLKNTSEEVAEMMVQIQKDQEEANVTKGKVEEIEAVASKQITHALTHTHSLTHLPLLLGCRVERDCG